MSRHRDVRCMNYSDEYDGYDDVYGHSVEDDYCVSPGAEQFMYDRSKQQNIAAFITEPDILEDNENAEEKLSPMERKAQLSDVQKAQLESCLDSIKNVIGDTVPDSELQEKIIDANFNTELVLDLILKESSPRAKAGLHSTEARFDHQIGVRITKHQSPSFTIPKISFKKRGNSPDKIAVSNSLMNNLDSLRNLAIDSPTKQFSSLSEMIHSHAQLRSPACSQNITESNSNRMTFNSLADLTANHFQKSNTNASDMNFNAKVPKPNFVLPKFSIAKDTRNISPDKQSYPIQVLQNNLSAHLVLHNTNDSNKDNLDQAKHTPAVSSVLGGMRTSSPDSLLIDLSTALKEAELLTSSRSNKTCSIPSTDKEISRKNVHISNEIGNSYIRRPTTLNLISLRNMKLRYAKNDVSAFGKTLCRTLKFKKPIMKSQERTCHAIKRFDFSTPYTRA